MTYLGKHLDSCVQLTIRNCKHIPLEGQVMAVSYLFLVSFLLFGGAFFFFLSFLILNKSLQRNTDSKRQDMKDMKEGRER